jgi:hypothetical protein
MIGHMVRSAVGAFLFTVVASLTLAILYLIAQAVVSYGFNVGFATAASACKAAPSPRGTDSRLGEHRPSAL